VLIQARVLIQGRTVCLQEHALPPGAGAHLVNAVRIDLASTTQFVEQIGSFLDCPHSHSSERVRPLRSLLGIANTSSPPSNG
jgi:hypothetical protein